MCIIYEFVFHKRLTFHLKYSMCMSRRNSILFSLKRANVWDFRAIYCDIEVICPKMFLSKAINFSLIAIWDRHHGKNLLCNWYKVDKSCEIILFLQYICDSFGAEHALQVPPDAHDGPVGPQGVHPDSSEASGHEEAWPRWRQCVSVSSNC